MLPHDKKLDIFIFYQMQAYIQQQKDIYQQVSEYLQEEDETDATKEFNSIITLIQKPINQYGKSEFISFLNLISHVVKNHCHSPHFHKRIETFLIHFQSDIKQNLSNMEIFRLFLNNKRILLSLIQNKIVELDQNII